jgi:hypothetical protein
MARLAHISCGHGSCEWRRAMGTLRVVFVVGAFALGASFVAAGCAAPSDGDSLDVASSTGGARGGSGAAANGDNGGALTPVPVAGDPPSPPPNQPGGCVVVRVAPQGAPSGAENGFAAAPPTGKRVIFLNRNGGTYYPGNGYDDSSSNRSSLVPQTVTMPAYSRTDAQWNQLVALARDTYAPYNVVVTDQDPGAAPHVEVVVSGHPSMIGQPSSAAGISPLTPDCSVIERAVVFAFDQLLQGPDDQARVVTHEAGHAFGLDHELYCPDLMSYLFDCAWPKHFIDQSVSCGEYQARACNCGGAQDSVQHLLGVLGKNDGTSGTDPGDGGGDAGTTTTTSSLTVTLTSPDDGATLDANSMITLSAAISGGDASKVLLEWEMSTGTVEVDCDAPPSGTTCQHSGGTVAFSFTAGTGSRAWSVRAVDASGTSASSERRTLTLSPPGSSLPTVAITSPSPGDTFSAGATVQVRANATGPSGVSQVWLTWTAPTASMQYPLTSLGGGAWGLDVPISAQAAAGARDLRVVAYDPSNQTGADDVSIEIQ